MNVKEEDKALNDQLWLRRDAVRKIESAGFTEGFVVTPLAQTIDHDQTCWPVAQSNLALYRQVYKRGYSPTGLIRIRSAYELSTKLFAGRFRPCGRPFVAHLVGTASILAEIGAPEELVEAGLIHAAYEQGDFGFTRWRDRRKRVRDAVGAAVEDLVLGYSKMRWNARTIRHLSIHLDQTTEFDRSVLLIRVANELEDHLDFAALLCRKAVYEDNSVRELVTGIAERLRQPRLAEALRSVFRAPTDLEWLAPLCTERIESYQLAWSYGFRLHRLVRYLPFLRYLPF